MSKIHKEAAQIIDKVEQQKGSIKGLTFSNNDKSKPLSSQKAVYALVCETLKYKEIIKNVLDNCENVIKESKIRQISGNLLNVLVYDMLIGEGIKGGGKLKKFISSQKPPLISALARLKIKHKARLNEELLPESIRNPILLPRYVRINTIVSKKEDVIETLVKEGHINKGKLLENVDWKQLGNEKIFYEDNHMPEILVFPPKTSFLGNKLLSKGEIILQDKASCLPSFILSPPPGSSAIDCCAAPGNKTTHLAALMNNEGTIYAFDKDSHRLETLKKLSNVAKTKIINPLCSDFLKINPLDKKYSDVEYILLDPSCSGSGIVSRMDHLLQSVLEGNTSEQEDIGGIFGEERSNDKKDGKFDKKDFKNKKFDKKNNKFDKKNGKFDKKNNKFNNKNNNKFQTNNEKIENNNTDDMEKEVDKVSVENSRLENLSKFQLKLLLHAFSFPSVKKITYSTCSVHNLENELVVQQALNSQKENPRKFELINILPTWTNRGYLLILFISIFFFKFFFSFFFFFFLSRIGRSF
eukprot:TRINITY_DN2323_c1_g1_i2.p1 TRINITY_DN2323_c1_g1~~TRINITY_DN2323_c1_g1_i2.p1  ORF type:complete len:525 (-),score=151.30 TRINITY_DN2323_c1_g1_i2:408-1982(-)